MITDEMVEKAARAMCDEMWGDEDDWSQYRHEVRAALLAVIPDVVEEWKPISEFKPNLDRDDDDPCEWLFFDEEAGAMTFGQVQFEEDGSWWVEALVDGHCATFQQDGQTVRWKLAPTHWRHVPADPAPPSLGKGE